MRTRHRNPAPPSRIVGTIAAAGLAAALALAPLAAAPAVHAATGSPVPANSNPTNCRDSGGAKVCGRSGHTSLHAEPTVRMPQGQLFSNAWLPGYGRGHLPPIIALD